MIKLIPGQEEPKAVHSKMKLRFSCDCGNEFETMWASFTSGKSKTCGQCKLFRWKKSEQIKFGQLTLSVPLGSINRLTDKVQWQCDCGIQKPIKSVNVVNGVTVSCGCVLSTSMRNSKRVTKEEKTSEEWISIFPSIIPEKAPKSWSAGSGIKIKFRCKCSREFERKFNRVSSVSTCGKCNEYQVTNEQVINNFVYMGETKLTNSDSWEKLPFRCSCGKTVMIPLASVFRGTRQNCGQCNILSSEELSRTFGKLKLVDIKEIRRFSEQRLEWKCECGKSILPSFHSVISGRTKSCGSCKQIIDEWWIQHNDLLNNLQYPIDKSDSLFSIFRPSENIIGPRIPFACQCPICGTKRQVIMDSIRIGEALTCGCTSNKSSLAQREISHFIESLGSETIVEYPINGLKYDIAVPEFKTVIEYHGLKWHSGADAKKRDINKFENAIKSGWNFIGIFEDEWRENTDKVKNLLTNRFKKHFGQIKLRPSKCEVRSIDYKLADTFLNLHHYIGACKPHISYGVFYQDKLICIMSFKTPTRQSSHPWELVRMASNPEFRVYGIWSKLIRKFIQEFQPSSIVSFSDNRLFGGQVYGVMGFKNDGLVAPDYYWVKNKKRFHKSGLRKTEEEKKTGLTEGQLREDQGYLRVWDLGKIRWIYRIIKENVQK